MADWMIVYETFNEPEAYIVVGRLQVEGIQALVYRQPGAAALGITIGVLGSVTVLVRPADYERSRRPALGWWATSHISSPAPCCGDSSTCGAVSPTRT